MDINFFSSTKSFSLASVLSNKNKTLTYVKIYDSGALKQEPMAVFNVKSEDDEYATADIHAFEILAHTTKKGKIPT